MGTEYMYRPEHLQEYTYTRICMYLLIGHPLPHDVPLALCSVPNHTADINELFVFRHLSSDLQSYRTFFVLHKFRNSCFCIVHINVSLCQIIWMFSQEEPMNHELHVCLFQFKTRFMRTQPATESDPVIQNLTISCLFL